MYKKATTEEENETEKARTKKLANEEEKHGEKDTIEARAVISGNELPIHQAQDSLTQSRLQNELGSFAYSATLPSATEEETILENDKLYLKINNKGGQITEALIKGEVAYDDSPIYLVKDANASL